MKFEGEGSPLGSEFSRHICGDNIQKLRAYALSGMRSVIETWRQIGRVDSGANHIYDHYEFSFQPPTALRYGFHAINLTVPDYPDATVRYRTSYWSGSIQSPADVP